MCAIVLEGIMRINSVVFFVIFRFVVREQMLFKRFLICSSGGSPLRWSRTIYAILKEGIIGNIHVKLNEIWTSVSGGDIV